MRIETRCQTTLPGVPSLAATIEIAVNGERRSVPEGTTVLGLLEMLALEPARVAIEFDLSILRKDKWAETQLHPGSRLEIVQFVGGG